MTAADPPRLERRVAAARGRAEAAEYREERAENRRRVAQAYNAWLRQVIADATIETERTFTPGESIDDRLDRIARILGRRPPRFTPPRQAEPATHERKTP